MKLGNRGGLVHLVGHGEVPTRDVLVHHGRVPKDYRTAEEYVVLLCVPGEETRRAESVREAVRRASPTGRRA